jgi:hypothetical protein
MAMPNALTYYDMATIAAIKSFIVHGPGACTVKLFTAVFNTTVVKACTFVDTTHFNPSLIFVSVLLLMVLHTERTPCLQILDWTESG